MSADRLNSWKEIAAHFGRDVTTVQRWEKREGMPVHRHLHDRMGSVYAFRSELEAWVAGRRQRTPIAGTPVEPLPAASGWTHRFRLLVAAAAAAAAIGISTWLLKAEFFWTSPIADAQFLRVTDFEGNEQAAAISPDGRFVAFLSDRDGQTDVWITRLGSGEFHNLTRGATPSLLNPSVRMLSFSPDSASVMFWVGKPADAGSRAIGIWSVPTLGGGPRPVFEGVAEADYSPDGKWLVYHTTGPGDPMFITDAARTSEGRPVFVAPAGFHAHYPRWSPDGRFIYFVQGALPDKLDIWRIRPDGGTPEQITRHQGRVAHPVLLDARTIAYLATDADGSGPWLYSMDVERRVARKLGSGADRYTSLSASADARRLVTTLANPRRTLWRVPLAEAAGAVVKDPTRLPGTTGPGFSPRFGPGYLLYVSSNGAGESLWKVADGGRTVLWTGADAHVIGGPAVSRDGRRIAFAVRHDGKPVLRIVNADGTNGRIVSRSLALEGAPAWAPDAESIVTAVLENGSPQLVRVWLDGRAPSPLVREYARDPVWAPDGGFVVYSGPDIGTTFGLRAVTTDGGSHPLPPLTLTRGARHIAFLPGRHALVFMRGEIHHKNLWLLDLDTGVERQLTDFAADFQIRDFDISHDGREAIVERVQEQSDIVLLEMGKR